MEKDVGLTPAQVGFLESSIDGFDPVGWDVELAGQAASTRRFFRVSKGAVSYILVEWDSRDEDWPRFLGVEAFASAAGFDVLPRIFASDPVHGLILEEDLGTTTLKQFFIESHGSGGISSDDSHDTGMISPVEAMYRQVIDAMCGWHRLDVSNCQYITSRSMDAETFLWETGYFTEHCVIGFFGKEDILSFEWEEERRRMAEYAASLPKVNMHRDFQSENVMIHNGRIRIVDFQGARLGPAYYDLASLLYDPYVDLGDGVIGNLLNYYLKSNAGANSVRPLSVPSISPVADGDAADNDRSAFYVCAGQRLMQALGAYGNLSRNKGKPQYRQFIPAAIGRLSSIFDNYLSDDYPAMREVVNTCKDSL